MANDFIYARKQTDFTDSILDTVKLRDGYLLSELLHVTHMCKITDLDFNDCIEPNLDQPLNNDINNLWKLMSQHHWNVIRYLQLNDIDRAFRHQSKKFSCFMAILSAYSSRMSAAMNYDESNDLDQIHPLGYDDDPSWLLPVFNRNAHELRLLALPEYDEANSDDTEMADSMNSNSTIQTCNSQLLNAFTAIQRIPVNIKFKKVGVFIVVNQTLKTYYALHKFNLCNYAITRSDRLLRQYMQEENNQQEGRYSSYVLTYRYFLGKNLLLQHQYSSAIEHFDYVFTKCLDSKQCFSIKNKQQSLLYLVIVKMIHGSTPKMDILRKYKLNELIDLIEPIRLGSLKLFMDKIKQYEQFLFDSGLFFLIENLKLVTIRNLFRMYVYQIDQQQTNKILLEPTLLFLLNFGFEKENWFTINELIDILNSMIDKGMIKGYISYKFRILVVSAKDPFPKTFRFTSLLNTS